MRVFIVEDSAIVRERLVALLAEVGKDLEVVGEAQDPTEATQAIRKLKPDAVILDIRLPGGSGIEVLEQISRDTPAPVVMMLTNFPYPQYRQRCMELGANYFLDKTTQLDKVREIFQGMLQDH